MVFIEQNNGSPTVADRKTFTRLILRVILLKIQHSQSITKEDGIVE
ncbi:hypothetical protein AB62_3949 [Escherichia coli 2-210-07_S1_C3]|nr:hypothetical protein AB62_3949 [Escherichia coli 2-210-07_S1_C3]